MNWTVAVYGGPMFLVAVWWVVSAHKWFKGPKVNVEHAIHGDNYAADLERIEGINDQPVEDVKDSPQASFTKPGY